MDNGKSIRETEGELTYSAPLSLMEESIHKDCPVNNDGYLVPVSNTVQTTNIPVEFDDEVYLKSIQNNLTCTSEHSNVKMQSNPSYRGTAIPYNISNSTDV